MSIAVADKRSRRRSRIRDWMRSLLSTAAFAALPAYAVAPAQVPLAIDGNAWEGWGSAVAVDGDTAVVTSTLARVDGNDGYGAAYVYVRSGDGWVRQARLVAADPEAFTNYGRSVAIAGDTIVVGASNADGVQDATGAAYVYTRSGTTWTQTAKFSASDGEGFSDFGMAVALSGDTIAVGAPSTFIGGENVQGAVYVFIRSGATWTQQAKLVASDGAAFHNLGSAVSIDGNTLVAGAHQAEANGTTFAGAAYVFVRSGSAWSEQAKLVADDAGFSDEFGISVALDGDRALVGSRSANVGAASDEGAAYAFVRSGSAWTQEARLVATDGAAGDLFGAAVALDGDTALVGAPLSGALSGVDLDRGAIYAFSRSTGTWMQTSHITAVDHAQGDQFGAALGLSGTTVATGAPRAKVGENLEAGKAYALTLGVAELAVAPAALDFGDVATGTSPARTVTVRNTGTADMFLGQLLFIDADAASFSLANDTCSGQRIASGASCSTDVRFAPAVIASYAAKLVVPGSAGVAFVDLSGNGVAPPPQIAIEPGSVSATLAQGASTNEIVAVRHIGTSGTLNWQVTQQAGRPAGVHRPFGRATVPRATADLSHVDTTRFARSHAAGGRRTPVMPNGVPPIAHTLTHSASNDILAGNAIACADNTTGFTNANQYLRTFTLADFDIDSPLSVTNVTFAVENLTVTTTATVNLYTLSGDLQYTNLTRIGTATVALDPQSATLVTVPVTATVPADATLVAEIAVPDLRNDSGVFFFGTNADGQSAPSYIASPSCGASDPTDLAEIGFENMQLVLFVSGTTAAPPVDCTLPAWLPVSPTSGAVAPGMAQSMSLSLNTAGLAAGTYAANVCVTSNATDPFVVVPVTLEVTANGPGLATASTIDFGGIAPGHRVVRRATLRSSGTSALDVTAVSTPSAPFTRTGGSCPGVPFTLAPQQSCEVEFTLQPAAVGTVEATVTIASTAVTGPATITLRGAGIGGSDAIFRNGFEPQGD